jgi:tRNA (cytidine/uridine-2'-O-)-methyltransferase
MRAMFHVVLFQPEIPPNTGNSIRLVANSGCQLHLIEPLGFRIDDARLRRAGLDYRWMAAVHVHPDFASCQQALRTSSARWYAVETGAPRRYDEPRYRPGDVLVFGRETSGLPAAILEQLGPDAHIGIPMLAGNRSINLSNAVAIVTYEAWRQNGFARSG